MSTIEFKKDCIMKTMVSEITDISLSHDYKVLDDMIDGYFDVTGEYKVTKASMQKEEFMYTIPFSIALSSLIDKDTINLTIKDFNYTTEKDILHLKMSLNLDYKEIEIPAPEETHIEEEIIEEEIESTLKEEMDTVDEIIESIDASEENVFHNELMIDENMSSINLEETHEEIETIEETKIDIEDKKEAEASIQNIISGMDNTETYHKYKVYIMREEDTIESVAIKYNVTLDDLKEYNELDNIKIGDKIVIPFMNINAEN